MRNDLLHSTFREIDDESDFENEQPLNMALQDKGRILRMLRALMQAGGKHASSEVMKTAEANSRAVASIFGSVPESGESFHALIVPTADAHNSEYIAPCDARREFLTSFTGSAGTAVVTHKEAALWTDGRYFLQADQQLDKQYWTLMKQEQPGTPTIGEWLNKVLDSGSRVAVDPYTYTYEAWKKLETELAQQGNILVRTSGNLVDAVWTDRPERPSNSVVPLDTSFTGKTWQEKANEIREEMLKKGASTLILSALDDVAWLLNLRGSDIEYNPVFFSYAALTHDSA